jgi:hypothetical protein
VSSRIKTDARFALIPEWLLDNAALSHAAIRLYCVLDRYADAEGHAYPGRALLAERLGVKSVDTVDRAIKELVAAGAITVTRRYDDAGDPTSNLYILHRYPPEGVAARLRPPSRTPAAAGPQDSGDGGRMDAAQNENHLNEDPLTPVEASSPACSRHLDGNGRNCRACGTSPKQLAEKRRRLDEGERRETARRVQLAERERNKELRAASRSAQAEKALREARNVLAGAR